MAVFFVTGKLGAGKSLVCIGRVQEYLLKGRPIATNVDLNLEYLVPKKDRSARVYRLPDKPCLADLAFLGSASTSKMEKDNGLLVLDELGTWFNSRTHKDQDRQAVINWLLHSRKLQWDLLLIVQNMELIDKQARISLAEHLVVCRRTDRLPVPILGHLWKFCTGHKLPLPRCHIGTVYYGVGQGAIKIDTWLYRGTNLFKAYDTNQVFIDDYPHGVHCLLPPGYCNLKRIAKRTKEFYMRLTKIYFKKYSQLACVAIGMFIMTLVGLYYLHRVQAGQKDLTVTINKIVDGYSEVASTKGDRSKSSSSSGVFKRINYLIKRSKDKPPVYLFPLGGVIYNYFDYPYDVVFKGGVPFATMPSPVKEGKEKKGKEPGAGDKLKIAKK